MSKWKWHYENGKAVVEHNGKPSSYRKMMKDKAGLGGGPPATMSKRGWPKKATMSGVPLYQQKEAQDYLAKKGVPTEYIRDGHSAVPIWESRGHRNRFLKAMGYIDRSAGYGDYAGR